MGEYKEPPIIKKVSSREEIEKSLDEGKIASVSFRIPCACNMKCKYCYGSTQSKGLGFAQIKDAIKQAVELGAGNISLVGEGEPLLYRDGEEDLFSVVDCINGLGALATIFTNNTLVTPEVAKKLFERNTVVIAKQNSLEKETQEYFSGEGT